MTQTEYIFDLLRNGVRIQHVNKSQTLTIAFQRTVRMPDNRKTSQLPPNLGPFSLFKVSEYAKRLPQHMVVKGGLFFPMYRKSWDTVTFPQLIKAEREAMWINFQSDQPFLIKIYVGGVNAISGEHYAEDPATKLRRNTLRAAGKSLQDYVVTPRQLWLDGIATSPGIVKQFVAMPLGDGYSVEAQLTGRETSGGLQFEITPSYLACKTPFDDKAPSNVTVSQNLPNDPLATPMQVFVRNLNQKTMAINCDQNWPIERIMQHIQHKEGIPTDQQRLTFGGNTISKEPMLKKSLADMNIQNGSTLHLLLRLHGGSVERAVQSSLIEQSIAVGGMIKQRIRKDVLDSHMWNENATITFNVQIVNSEAFRNITGQPPPPTPVSAQTYHDQGLPFFAMYEEQSNVAGYFEAVRSIAEIENRTETSIQPRLIHLTEDGRHAQGLSLPWPVTTHQSEYVRDENGILSQNGPLRQFRTVSDLEKETDKMTIAVFKSLPGV